MGLAFFCLSMKLNWLQKIILKNKKWIVSKSAILYLGIFYFITLISVLFIFQNPIREFLKYSYRLAPMFLGALLGVIFFIASYIILKFLRFSIVKYEKGNEELNKHETENLEEYDNLRTHYALHNIKNATKNMDWSLQSIDRQNVTENELENLKANLRRINETLDDFNKLNNIREQKQFEIQELEDIFNKLIRPSAKTKSIKFSFVYDDEIPKDLIINQTFYDVFQIFNNLIVNAQKAMESTERKELCIIVNQVNEQEVWFKVCDTGVGISSENRNKIFDIHFSTTSGTGIGLAYVRNELKKMGGQIALIAPNENFSTIFEVKIPINQI